MNTMVAMERTRYTNFHSFILPALRFMQKKGVNVHYDTRISDVDFKADPGAEKRWIERIHLTTRSGAPKPSVLVRDTDLVFLTIGSIVSNASFGAHDRPVDRPAVDGLNLGGAWTLWKKIAAGHSPLHRASAISRRNGGHAPRSRSTWTALTTGPAGQREASPAVTGPCRLLPQAPSSASILQERPGANSPALNRTTCGPRM